MKLGEYYCIPLTEFQNDRVAELCFHYKHMAYIGGFCTKIGFFIVLVIKRVFPQTGRKMLVYSLKSSRKTAGPDNVMHLVLISQL